MIATAIRAIHPQWELPYMEAVTTYRLAATNGRSSPRLRWLLPILFLFAGIAAFPFDVQISSRFVGEGRPGWVGEYLEICEAFGHGFGASLIIIAVVTLDRSKLRCLPWLFSASLGAGLVANIVKVFVHRTRPRDFDLDLGTIWDTFTRAHAGGGAMQSMPSAHTATAVGLAVILANLYPQGRWYFSLLATLVGVQRIATTAHFPSDVCVGAAVGCFVGLVCANRLKTSVKAK